MNNKVTKHILLFVSSIFLAGVLSSCLKNDIPYPIIQVNILEIEAEGQISASIDEKERVVTFTFPEQADLRNVKITKFTIPEGTRSSRNMIDQTLNLTKDQTVTLSLYQDYQWTLKAQQNIERYFVVDGAVGNATIDAPARRVVCNVSKSVDLKFVHVDKIKLGAADVSTMSPDLNNTSVDFTTQPVKVLVSAFDTSEYWSIYINQVESDVELTQVDAWTRVIWAYANAQEGKDNGFEYRMSGSDTWTKVPDEDIITDGGALRACIHHLEPTTSYDVRATSDNAVSSTQTVVTDSEYTVPNFSFDEWNLDGKLWNPWAIDDEPYWGNGNKGATTLGNSNSLPSEDTWNGGPGYSAKLETRFIGIGVVGKLAAGNLFTGTYVKTDGTNGILDFGRPFTGRPTRLHGYWKHKAANITHTSSEFIEYMGRPDTAQIYITLTDWDAPYEIRTNPKNRHLFDINDPHIIGYGTVQSYSDIPNWTEFVIDIDYRATNRRPKYILIVCSASKLGDYFTGGDGGEMQIDNFFFDWDY